VSLASSPLAFADDAESVLSVYEGCTKMNNSEPPGLPYCTECLTPAFTLTAGTCVLSSGWVRCPNGEYAEDAAQCPSQPNLHLNPKPILDEHQRRIVVPGTNSSPMLNWGPIPTVPLGSTPVPE
jgi:hypothetical protein